MKPYLQLLLRREAKEVLGRGGANLWTLTLVLVATFSSIAFSKGSMNYLQDKMEDPFTNWVSIAKATDDNRASDEEFNRFRDSLYDEANMKRFDYSAVLMSQHSHYTMVGLSGRNDYLSGLFFEQLNTRLVRQVLSPDNIVAGCRVDTTLLADRSLGVILTLGAIQRIGYSETHLPSYVSYLAYNEGADSLGFRLLDEDKLPVALPVLAVVRRLPGNAQMMAANYLYEQLTNSGANHPFHIAAHTDDYLRQLAFFVAEEQAEAFDAFAATAIPDSLRAAAQLLPDAGDRYAFMRCWRPGSVRMIAFGDGSTPLPLYQQVAYAIEDHFGDPTAVCRVFPIDAQVGKDTHSMSLAVEFRSLDHIGAFEAYAKEHHIQLEMEQVHSKQNFNAVTTMASVLSAAMVVFSIVCIIMFMVNMLQSYFQKVKHNIGTFKAFGMNGAELIKVYVMLLVAIVTAAVIMALAVTWLLQLLLPAIGVEKGGFNYLDVWNDTTCIATAVIFLSTVMTVVAVMTRLLSQTPGDLIYDRD